MEVKIKYQTKTITVPAGTYAADTPATSDITLEDSYDTITGIAVHEQNPGAITSGSYRLGIRNEIEILHDQVSRGGWATGPADGTNPNERFKSFNYDFKGAKVQSIMYTVPAGTVIAAGGLTIDVVFRIEKRMVRQS